MTTTPSFQISALPIEPFEALFDLSDTELLEQGARRCEAATKPGFPCRVSLQDADVGEKVILLHFAHHDVDSPYRASGPIYVREQAVAARLEAGELPEVIEGRQLSLRAYNHKHLMRAAVVCDGAELKPHIEGLLADPKVAYLHVHNALPGCFSCRVDRPAESAPC